MTSELDEPFGRHRWDPLIDAEQPLISPVAPAASGGEDTPDLAGPPSTDATS